MSEEKKLKTLDEILTEWKNDTEPFDEMDPAKLQEKVVKLGSLHSKYTRYYAEYRVQHKKDEAVMFKLRKIKWLYYNGKLSEEELKKYELEPFQFVLKSDINIYMDADKDMIAHNKTLEYQKAVLDTCEKIIKEINAMGYQYTSLMKYIMWTQGSGV